MNTLPGLSQRRLLRSAALLLVSVVAFNAASLATTFTCTSGAQFAAALTSVKPGDTILLSGTITGNFVTSVPGTATGRILIEGDGTAVIQASPTSGAPYSTEPYSFYVTNTSYYDLKNFIIQGGSKGLVLDGSSHGTVDHVHVNSVQQEGFKVRRFSTDWVLSFCSARNTGLEGDYGEGFYCGTADSDWSSPTFGTGGKPDVCAYVTYFECYATQTFNDGFDAKEGSHDIKYVNCQADYTTGREPAAGAKRGNAGFFNRAGHSQYIKCRVNNLANGEWAWRFDNESDGGIAYGTGNQVKQGEVSGGNVSFIYVEGSTAATVYTDFIQTDGAPFYYQGSSTVTLGSPASFTEDTWSGEGGGLYGNLDPEIGCSDPLGNPPPAQVATPAFSPAAGAYASAQRVTLSDATGGATLYYTTDGTTPTTSSAVYSSPIPVSSGTVTIEAMGAKSGLSNSSVASAIYTIVAPQVVTPAFSPASGTYSSAQSVTISDATGGASIRYTTDGSAPSETAGTLYSGPVSIANSAIVKAIAYESGFTDSTVASAVYTITAPPPPQVVTPAFSPASGTYSSAQSVMISDATGGASIRYTTDGSAPSETAGTVYSGPVSVTNSATVKAIAYESGFTDSAIASAVYTIGGSCVTAAAGGGWVNNALAAQTATFTATFDATPSASPTNAVVALSNGAQSSYANFPCLVRFNPSGDIDARNGGSYVGSATPISYSAGLSDHFRLVIDVSTQTYSIYVTPAGGAELTVGTNFAFRVSASSLSNLGVYVDNGSGGTGTVTVCNFSIGGTEPSAATPSFSPVAGTYTAAQSVAIATGTSGASIRYTTDGSTPSESNGTLYSGPISIAATATVRAIAYASGYTDSLIASAVYTITAPPPPQVATPAFSPASGTYSSAQSVTISDATGGASIRYTTDGSAPSETAGTLYSGPVNVASSATLNAIAYESGLTDSAIASAAYTIAATNRSLTGSSGNGFHALALTSAQTGTFTATFDATPSVSPENAVVGLSNGVATGFGNLGCIARFNPSGDIDAYNGAAYGTSTIKYSAGVSYHFRLVVNVTAHTYSVYVTPAGGSEVTVGANYAFRSSANTMTSLNDWDLDVDSSISGASLTASNLAP